MSRFVRIRKAAELTGYTEKAINRKIDSGIWLEGALWHRAPDGSRMIDMENYELWVLGKPQIAMIKAAA